MTDYQALADAAVRALGWERNFYTATQEYRYWNPEWNQNQVQDLPAEAFIKDGRTVLALLRKVWEMHRSGEKVVGILRWIDLCKLIRDIPKGADFEAAIAEAALRALGEIE